jgi:hypothetical protein
MEGIQRIAMLGCIACVALIIVLLCIWIGTILPMTIEDDLPSFIAGVIAEDEDCVDPSIARPPLAAPPHAAPPRAAPPLAAPPKVSPAACPPAALCPPAASNGDSTRQHAELKALLEELQRKDAAIENRLKSIEANDAEMQRLLQQRLQQNRVERTEVTRQLNNLDQNYSFTIAPSPDTGFFGALFSPSPPQTPLLAPLSAPVTTPTTTQRDRSWSSVQDPDNTSVPTPANASHLRLPTPSNTDRDAMEAPPPSPAYTSIVPGSRRIAPRAQMLSHAPSLTIKDTGAELLCRNIRGSAYRYDRCRKHRKRNKSTCSSSTGTSMSSG